MMPIMVSVGVPAASFFTAGMIETTPRSVISPGSTGALAPV